MSARLVWREASALGGQVVSRAFDDAREAAAWRVENPGLSGHSMLTLKCVLDDGTLDEAPLSDVLVAVAVFVEGTRACGCEWCVRTRRLPRP